jgi:RNA polymerase sigma factor (sigma-70 family)
MDASTSDSVTQLLAAVGRGDSRAQQKLWALVYDELHRLAQCELAGHDPVRNPHATSLVHDLYLRLTANADIAWANRRHFFATAARALRCIRIDDVRKRQRLKRGGPHAATKTGEPPDTEGREGRRVNAEARKHVVSLEADVGVPSPGPDPIEVLAIDEALNKLEQIDPRKAEVVMLRYFAGLTRDETAAALELSPRTVDNEWRLARAWLYRELS